jgi:hypothetical protein
LAGTLHDEGIGQFGAILKQRQQIIHNSSKLVVLAWGRQRAESKFYLISLLILFENCARLIPACARLSKAQPILESTEFIYHDVGTKDSVECLCVH